MGQPLGASSRCVFYLLTCVAFMTVIGIRGGPNPAELDAHAVTLPTTAITHGDFRSAERATSVPNPPGYPLLTSPFVLALGPWIGSERWCDDKPVPAVLRSFGATFFAKLLVPCSTQRPGSPNLLPHWYRSQAVLVVLAWIVLLAGAVMLLHAAGAGGGVGEVVLLALLVAFPSTTDAVAQTFHPQDLMCVGLTCAGLAQALRRRWVTVGVLLGSAFLCKQFVVLPALAIVVAAPGWRARARLVVSAAAVVVAGVMPFFVLDRTDTLHALTAVYVAGVNLVKTPTVLGLLAIGEQRKVELARDLPLVVGVVMVLLVRRRAGPRLLAPVPLVGLSLACLALRLVFELSFFDYYFLATGAFLLVLSAVRRRPPLWPVCFIVATRFGLTALAPRGPSALTACVFLAAALSAVGTGLWASMATPAAPDASGSAPWREEADGEAAGSRRRGAPGRGVPGQGTRTSLTSPKPKTSSNTVPSEARRMR